MERCFQSGHLCIKVRSLLAGTETTGTRTTRGNSVWSQQLSIHHPLPLPYPQPPSLILELLSLILMPLHMQDDGAAIFLSSSPIMEGFFRLPVPRASHSIATHVCILTLEPKLFGNSCHLWWSFSCHYDTIYSHPGRVSVGDCIYRELS